MKTPREVLLSQHRHVEPKLNRMWAAALAPRLAGNVVWHELILPCRRIWAGLACAWVVILAAHFAFSEPAAKVAGKTSPPSREEVQALAEQRQMLAQMIEAPREADKRNTKPPGPRSEKALRTSIG